MKSISQLQQLLQLDVPFAVLFTNSYLGSDSFVIALASDCRRHRLNWEESYSRSQLKESALSSADFETFAELRKVGLLQRYPLGTDGMAYELNERPFRPYYQQAAARRFLDEAVVISQTI
ncbi:hypothetical protein [Spirosoma endbachense]|uniref:Uncharacterized protein n=1 Tax=Spirosoma endbachense TaxID=2666025 RepID=A0A6P1VZS7_9BACT|nr:hypothetical protein [Spirosoma endbachense]QHV97287.1 hypothetical protein GJR95_20760 [Spirosoma endbachense]